MGKTIRFGERSKESFKEYSKKYPELLSPRVFYNKLESKETRAKQLAKKRRTTYK
ncbi:MAG: hypothetical protein AAB632_02305 [Patescibacteria group bacterium]